MAFEQNVNVDDHFRDLTKMVSLGSGNIPKIFEIEYDGDILERKKDLAV